jgi:hypothetical protein
VISFIEAHYLLDAKIDDGGMARMANDRFHCDGGPVRRQMVCEVRNKLEIIYRSPLQVQDVKPEREAMRCTVQCAFVKQIQGWRRAGIIKNLIFSDESRLCRAGMVPCRGLPERARELLGPGNRHFMQGDAPGTLRRR